MAYTAKLEVTLADTNWSRKTAADFAPTAGFCTPSATDRFLAVHVESVTTNDCSIFWGERVGDSDTGDAGYVVIPDFVRPGVAERFNDAQFTLGNQTITFRNVAASSGTVIGYSGKTRAAVVTEAVALLTAGTTGIGDLETQDAEEPGMILFQSDASTASVPSWTQGDGSVTLIARDLIPVDAEVLTAAGTFDELVFPDGMDVRAISLRANIAASTVVLYAEIAESGAGPRRGQ